MNFILFLLSFYRNHSQGLLYLDEGLTAQLMNKIVHFTVWKILIFFPPLSLPKRINLYIVRTILFVLFWFQSCSYNCVHVCMRAQLLQLCLTLCDPTGYSPPGSSVHGILQAGILEWVAMPSSRGSSWHRDQTHVSCTGRWILYPLSHVGSQYIQYVLFKKEIGQQSFFCTKNVAISTS